MSENKKEIKVAIVGVGNCCSSLIQGIHFYKNMSQEDARGIISYDINGYKIGDIKIVAAIDIDERKIGKDLSESIFAPPNCAKKFYPNIPILNVPVSMGNPIDGVSEWSAQDFYTS